MLGEETGETDQQTRREENTRDERARNKERKKGDGETKNREERKIKKKNGPVNQIIYLPLCKSGANERFLRHAENKRIHLNY